MGDRTNIADALDEAAAWHAENCVDMHGDHPLSEDCCFSARISLAATEAARLLRADPDTSDEWSAQPQSATLVTEQPDGSVTRTQVQRVSLREVYDPDTSDGLFTEARRLLDAATPGPWTHPSPTANWFTTPQPIQIDEADWGQETQEGGAMCGYRIGTLADERAWRYADVELIAAAPRLIAALLERAVTAEARSSCPGLSVRQQAEMLAVRCTAEQLVILRDLWADEMDRRKGGQDDR